MILPTKHITAENSLIGGALLLSQLDSPTTVSTLWQEEMPQIATFERSHWTLDLLYLMNVIEYHDGNILRVSR